MDIFTSSKRFYLDDNQFSFTVNGKSREVYLIGGYSVSLEKESVLEQRIAEVKSRFGLQTRHPMKWNIRGLEKYYQENNEDHIFKNIMRSSDDIRFELLKIISDEQLQISTFVSAIVRLKRHDPPKISYQRCFSNLLQRMALNAGRTVHKHEVFIDFFKEDAPAIAKCYSCGFHDGIDAEGNRYIGGSLYSVRFSQCIYFGKTLYNPFLQLADLVTGCSKDFIECCLKRKDFGRVKKYFPVIMARFWKEPSSESPFRRGIIVSPPNFYHDLKKGYREIEHIAIPF